MGEFKPSDHLTEVMEVHLGREPVHRTAERVINQLTDDRIVANAVRALEDESGASTNAVYRDGWLDNETLASIARTVLRSVGS